MKEQTAMALIRAKACIDSPPQRMMSLSKFSAACKVVEQQGGTFIEPGLLQAKWIALSIIDASDAKKKAKARNIMSGEKVRLFINNLSGECHGKFKRSLANAHASRANSCPATIEDTMSRTSNY